MDDIDTLMSETTHATDFHRNTFDHQLTFIEAFAVNSTNHHGPVNADARESFDTPTNSGGPSNPWIPENSDAVAESEDACNVENENNFLLPKRSYEKCDECRKNHKKCLPPKRTWPGQSCDECVRYNRPCGPNMTASRSSSRKQENHDSHILFTSSPQPQKLFNSPMITSPIQGSSLAILPRRAPEVIDFTSEVDFLAENLSTHASWTKSTSLYRCFHLRPDYFGLLFDRSWMDYADPPPQLLVVPMLDGPGPVQRRKPRLHEVVEHRRSCIVMNDRYVEHVQELLDEGISVQEATVTAKHEVLQRCHGNSLRHWPQHRLEKNLGRILEQGRRWRKVVQYFASDEVLLLTDPGPSPGPSELRDDPTLSRIKMVVKCIDFGDEKDFDKNLDTLTAPHLFLQEICWRLEGISSMIFALGKLGREGEARQQLAHDITRRIQTVFDLCHLSK